MIIREIWYIAFVFWEASQLGINLPNIAKWAGGCQVQQIVAELREQGFVLHFRPVGDGLGLGKGNQYFMVSK